MSQTCRDVMNQRYEVVDGLMTVAEALTLMREKGYRKVIIKKRDQNDEYGMVQLSDIAHEVIAKNRAPERVNLYEIMIKPFICVRPEMNIKYCARLFERYGLNSAPVVENDQVIGVVSHNDIVLNWTE
ncbi:CBS domain-containing protein [Reinekea marinisedimentorum]|uniref:CBS domain protein n=1 Tax=Reinekea marinisedimentorum TaxID=230495 RepID=A0A4V2UJR9_9GAMM|nr:CBS domain-containing protein [Reinekea marinisedimentorum]TCS41066.1 CBS domain protein [Reinekea marinisedimentorum]